MILSPDPVQAVLSGLDYLINKPWSVDSLNGGFMTSELCSAGRSKIKNKKQCILHGSRGNWLAVQGFWGIGVYAFKG